SVREVEIHTDFFFFQAEDGIRDFHVTGVQTCALPISSCSAGRASSRSPTQWIQVATPASHSTASTHSRSTQRNSGRCLRGARRQIGRASCREREDRPDAAVSKSKTDKIGEDVERAYAA